MHPRPSRRLNLLYVITSSDIGGEERHLLQLAVHMRDAGHLVQACCLRTRGLVGAMVEAEGIPLTCFNEAERPGAGEVVRGARRLARMIEEHDIDLVHSFLVRANVETRLGARLSSRACAVVNSEGCINLRKSRSLVWLDRATSRWCDVIVANCGAVADVLLQRERIPRSKIRVVYQGIDVADFGRDRRTASLRDTREVVIGYVGRLHPEKGAAYLIDAVAVLAPTTPAFRVVMVGDGGELPALRAAAARRGLGNRVSFVGRKIDIASLMRTFDVVAIPSLEEGLPTVAMEALACGVPVVATAVGGTPEAIDHGHTGLLVPSADVASLARALDSLITSSHLRKQLGRDGPRIARERFHVGRMLAETVGVYEDVLDTTLVRAESAA